MNCWRQLAIEFLQDNMEWKVTIQFSKSYSLNVRFPISYLTASTICLHRRKRYSSLVLWREVNNLTIVVNITSYKYIMYLVAITRAHSNAHRCLARLPNTYNHSRRGLATHTAKNHSLLDIDLLTWPFVRFVRPSICVCHFYCTYIRIGT